MRYNPFFYKFLKTITVFMFFVFISCNNDDNNEGNIYVESQFKASIGSMPETRISKDQYSKDNVIISIDSLTTNNTRASVDNTWDGNEQISVYIDNMLYDYNITNINGSMSSSNPYYFTDVRTHSIQAWYPKTTSALTSFSVKSDQSILNNYQASDLLFSSRKNVTADQQELNSFSHKTAKLTIQLTMPNYLSDANTIKVKCGTTNFCLNGIFSINNETLTANTAGQKGQITMYKSGANTYVASLIPGQKLEQIQVLLNQAIFTAKVNCNIESGKSYSCNVSVRDGVVTSGTYRGHAYTDMGLSVKWATMNDGATSYLEYGDMLNRDTPTESWPGWTLPTPAQMRELIDNCVCTWITIYNKDGITFNTSNNGNTLIPGSTNLINGFLFTSKINGNALFLPAAGIGNWNKNIHNKWNTLGWYANTNTYQEALAYGHNTKVYLAGMLFTQDYLQCPTQAAATFDGRTWADNGFSIRAVTN